MGSKVVVEVTDGAPGHLSLARDRLAFLEARWSRFRVSSDLSRLNAAQGEPVVVDESTIELLEAMVHGYTLTDGSFDPTLLAPLVRLGYAASVHDPALVTDLPIGVQRRGHIRGLVVDLNEMTVRLPPGTAVDAGGIGKGLAADMVAGLLDGQRRRRRDGRRGWRRARDGRGTVRRSVARRGRRRVRARVGRHARARHPRRAGQFGHAAAVVGERRRRTRPPPARPRRGGPDARRLRRARARHRARRHGGRSRDARHHGHRPRRAQRAAAPAERRARARASSYGSGRAYTNAAWESVVTTDPWE